MGQNIPAAPNPWILAFAHQLVSQKTGKGAELTARHREEMGKFWRRTVVSPSSLPEGTHAVSPCCYITFGVSTS